MFLNIVIKTYLMTSAIIPNKKVALIAIILISTLSIIAIGGMIIAIFATNEYSYRTITMGLLSCIIFSCSLQVIAKLHERSLIHIMQKLLHNTFRFTEKAIKEEAETEMEQKFWRLIITLMMCTSTCIFCPYLYFITKPEIKYDDPDLQVIPFFLAYWKTETLSEYLAMVMLQLSITGITILAYWSFTIFTIYGVVNLQKHIQALNTKVHETLDLYTKSYYEKYVVGCDHVYIRIEESADAENQFQRSLSKSLANAIEYHQFIHRYSSDFVTFLNRPYTSVFSWYISSSIVFAYSFLQVIGDDVVFFIKTLSLTIHGAVALYLYCHMAQIVNDLNESIMDAFYYTEWYNLPPKIRKTLIMVLMQCQQKYKIKSFAMYTVNLNLFIRSLRIVYSVLNVILVSQKK